MNRLQKIFLGFNFGKFVGERVVPGVPVIYEFGYPPLGMVWPWVFHSLVCNLIDHPNDHHVIAGPVLVPIQSTISYPAGLNCFAATLLLIYTDL